MTKTREDINMDEPGVMDLKEYDTIEGKITELGKSGACAKLQTKDSKTVMLSSLGAEYSLGDSIKVSGYYGFIEACETNGLIVLDVE